MCVYTLQTHTVHEAVSYGKKGMRNVGGGGGGKERCGGMWGVKKMGRVEVSVCGCVCV